MFAWILNMIGSLVLGFLLGGTFWLVAQPFGDVGLFGPFVGTFMLGTCAVVTALSLLGGGNQRIPMGKPTMPPWVGR